MKKRLLLAVAVLSCVACAALLFATPVLAGSCAGANTSMVECDDNASGVWEILQLVVNILTAGIMVLATIGLIIVGIQYVTAGGSEEKTKIAKKRAFEIVVGIVAYVLFFVVFQLILPSNSDTIVSVEKISVNADILEVYVEDNRQLGVVVEPTSALVYNTVTWTSSDESVVSVTKTGTISAKKAGTAKLTASTGNDKKVTLTVKVLEKPKKTDDSTKPTTSGDGTKPIASVEADSTGVACATGTIDLGIDDNAYLNGKRISARICEVPTIDCSSSYSFSSNGHVVVNSRVSGAYYALGQRYMDQHGGKKLRATESYRSNARQTYFYNCYINKNCNNGNLASKPGYSNHQLGLAIDFDDIGGWNTSLSNWFYANTGDFGLVRDVSSEYWHVNPQKSYY